MTGTAPANTREEETHMAMILDLQGLEVPAEEAALAVSTASNHC
ncbi:class III lanthipeptide [Streptomyces sp. NPDC000070]